MTSAYSSRVSTLDLEDPKCPSNHSAIQVLRRYLHCTCLRYYIRSNTMSHITFKMCQFVLIIHLKEYHYDFESCYGVLQLTYTTYQNLCPADHFFGRLLMSQDISPTWIVLIKSIHRIIQVFFSHFPCLKTVLWFDSLCLFPIFLNFLNYRIRISRVFHLSIRSSASFANCQPTSVDSCTTGAYHPLTACLNLQKDAPSSWTRGSKI